MIENAEGNEELFHLHVKWIGRNSDDNKRRDVVACAAYRSGECLENTKKGKPSDFTHKAATRLYSEILIPEGSPLWASDRAALWNAVEAFEKRKDARLAIEFVAAFPYSVPEDKRTELLRAFLQRYVEDGYAVDFAIHLGEDGGNPHAHMMMTMRRFDGDTFSSQKERSLSQRRFVTDARKHWEETTNTVLAALGTGAYVDSRSLRDRGIDRMPKRHQRPDRVARAQKREKFQREQEDRAMRHEPTRIERRIFPLLTQREDWHPEKMQAKSDMTPEELKELKQYHEMDQPELEPILEPVEWQGSQKRLDPVVAPEPTPAPSRPLTEREALEEQAKIQEMLMEEQARDKKDIEIRQAMKEPETSHERDMRRAARSSGDTKEIERIETEIISNRVNEMRARNWEYDEAERYQQHFDRQIDDINRYTPEERQRVEHAESRSPKEARMIRSEIFRSRLDEYERHKQERHEYLKSHPHEHDEYERLYDKASNQIFRTPDESERLKMAWELVYHTKDIRALRMTEEQILTERMERIRAKEREQARDHERDRMRQRERDERNYRDR